MQHQQLTARSSSSSRCPRPALVPRASSSTPPPASHTPVVCVRPTAGTPAALATRAARPHASDSSSRRANASSSRANASSSSTSSMPAAAAAPAVDYFAHDQRPVILFDGVCNLCNGGVNFMLDWDRAGAFRLAALQSAAGRQLLVRCGRAPDDISSIVLVEPRACHVKSEAVLRIASRLGAPLPLVAAALGALPLLVRDPFYDLVASNRYVVFGRTSSCRLSSDGFADRFLAEP